MSEPSTDKKKIILSGMQPSGILTIGNYLGALKNWVTLQSEYDCLFMVVDLHALTVKQVPADLRSRCLSFSAQYLASGIDPEQSTIFLQSHVSEHAELAWVLNTMAYMGELSRMTQFKDKSQRHEENVNAGLLTYPVLMAADVLLYQANLVPVGSDQKQHLELTRDLAQRFNQRYSETFTVPEPFIPKVGARIMSLQDPTKKMSKSDENPDAYIGILETPEVIRRKIKRAVTDSGTDVRFDETRPGVSNLITIHAALSGKSVQEIEDHFAGKGYGDLKGELAELLVEGLAPIQKRYAELMGDKTGLEQILARGAERARGRARRTLSKVFRKVGLVPAQPPAPPPAKG
ncbi:tryptophan--tRNA ligase [Chondromyces apiculatus]|uniref:Tryptophan--tRNA ligase n=1 Tax=Chondromyces apiculatus DSM 436 TaxID=1192034 RepID=A0A017STP7_9BACT|nr:tryptophan--tRNA ligase [Chondromyces apiculatus]EYF00368.1 Tryptophanyl-tRNA synthetase [Chondromyces apiculatus DSM 436]